MFLFGFVQEIENEKLKLEQVQILEENSGLRVQNQKLSEEASYAKELASAAAVELKNLAGEVTKLSLQNANLEKELIAAQELSHSWGSKHAGNNGNRKCSDNTKPGRKGRHPGRTQEINGAVYDDFEFWNLDPDDVKMELQARKQREMALEAALAEKEIVEDDYRKKLEEAKERESALENDLANMWVLVAQLKKDGGATPEPNTDERHPNGLDNLNDLNPKADDADSKITVLKETQVPDVMRPAHEIPKEEPLVVRLKVVILNSSWSASSICHDNVAFFLFNLMRPLGLVVIMRNWIFCWQCIWFVLNGVPAWKSSATIVRVSSG